MGMMDKANQNDSKGKGQKSEAQTPNPASGKGQKKKLSAARKAELDQMTISELALLESDGESEAVKEYAKTRGKTLKDAKAAKEKKDNRVGSAAKKPKEFKFEHKGSENPALDQQKEDMAQILNDAEKGAVPSYADAKAQTGGTHAYDASKDTSFAGDSGVQRIDSKSKHGRIAGENQAMKDYNEAQAAANWQKQADEKNNATLKSQAQDAALKKIAGMEVNLYKKETELQKQGEKKLEGGKKELTGTSEKVTNQVDIKGGGIGASTTHTTESIGADGYKITGKDGYEKSGRTSKVTESASIGGSAIDPATGKVRPGFSAEVSKTAEYNFAKRTGTNKLSDKVKGAYSGEIGTASATAKGGATWNPEDGVKVTGSAGAKATLVGGSYKFTFGPYNFKILGQPMKAEFTAGASAKVVAEANGEVELNAKGGDEGVDVGFGGKAAAFAGAKAGVEVGAKISWAKKPEYRMQTEKYIDELLSDASWFTWLPDKWEDKIKTKAATFVGKHVIGEGGLKDLLTVKAGVEGSAGVGGEASFGLGLSGGKFRCSGTLKGTVGLGVGAKLNLAIDMLDGFRFLGIMLFDGGAEQIANYFGISVEQIKAEIDKRIDEAKKGIGQYIYELGQDSWIPGAGRLAKKAASALGYEPT